MKEFNIEKILTHNIILGSSEDKEFILIGKGIGFQRKPGSKISSESVASYYIIQNSDKLSEYEKIVFGTAASVLLATEKAIKFAEEKLDTVFDENIHISLLDHVNFALFRLENKLQVGSFLTDEYYLMYSDLYDIAFKMVESINSDLDVELPHSEVGSIILHMHAALHKEKVSSTALYAQIIDYSLTFIQDRLPKAITSNSIAKARLITHLKFALKRIESDEVRSNPLVDVIKEKYPEVYEIAADLSGEIEERYNVKLPESEIGYIALHVYNLQY
ncbi:MAG: PRD domain-containing protein [Erysipelothrix sp.]|nr:PRD domain-containing protein [Erysipelothrix sp.]